MYTTSMLDKSSTMIHDHFLIVFSSTSAKAFLVCSIEYCFKKFKPHKRCFGAESAGESFLIFFQMISQTIGVTPKNDLKRLRLVSLLWVAFVFVYRFPIFKNVAEDISDWKETQENNCTVHRKRWIFMVSNKSCRYIKLKVIYWRIQNIFNQRLIFFLI